MVWSLTCLNLGKQNKDHDQLKKTTICVNNMCMLATTVEGNKLSTS